MGPYPLFSCHNWSQLAADLEEVSSDLVSVVLVPESFTPVDRTGLERCFDRVTYFKDHFTVDLRRPVEENVKRSHREAVRRARRKVDVRVCPQPSEYLDAWVDLWAVLSERHKIGGFRAFSRDAFARQLATPGMVMFEAHVQGETVGLDLWYLQGDVAYGHLVAFSERGYKLRASYATKWEVLHYFADKARWIDLGGAPGAAKIQKDGLARFKEGWATGTRPVYICARTFQPDAYRELCAARGVDETGYFPAYRQGEFA